MKLLTNAVIFLGLVIACKSVNAQRIKINDGNLSVLKSEKTINVEFTYDNMKVGKFDKEDDYLSTKKEEYNKKEPAVATTGQKPGSVTEDFVLSLNSMSSSKNTASFQLKKIPNTH